MPDFATAKRGSDLLYDKPELMSSGFQAATLRGNEHNSWIPRDLWLERWERKRSSIFIGRIRRKGIGDLRS